MCAFIVCCPVCRKRPYDGLILCPRATTDLIKDEEIEEKLQRPKKGIKEH
jgi:hypothetical protein